MSTLAWQSWVDLSPATAQALEVAPGDVVEVTGPTGAVRAPVRVTAEVADNAVALAFGQGHTALGRWRPGGASMPSNCWPVDQAKRCLVRPSCARRASPSP